MDKDDAETFAGCGCILVIAAVVGSIIIPAVIILWRFALQ